MELLQQWLLTKYLKDTRIISLCSFENPEKLPSITDGFDILLIIVTHDHTYYNYTYHYIRDGLRIQERWFSVASVEKSTDTRKHQFLFQWILKGNILIDHDNYLEGFCHRMLEFPNEIREKHLLIEFSVFLRRYLHSKECLVNEHILDAYNSILEALHQWARIVVIEEGYHPEITIWRQVRIINPGVYKLYEELTMSKETIKQRVQLVLLACEFSVISKMERCCKIIIRIIATGSGTWNIDSLTNHPDLQQVKSELPLLLNKLALKKLIYEIVDSNEPEHIESELNYQYVEVN